MRCCSGPFILRALLLSWAVLGGGACAAIAAPASGPIKLGLLLPQDADEAASLRQGAALGIQHANQMPGRKSQLVARGKAGQWGTEGNEAAVLALDDEAAALITPTGGTAAHEILQIAGRTRIPVVSLCPDSSVTGAKVPWAVQIAPNNRDQATAIFTGLKNKSGAPLHWTAVVPAERAGREVGHDLKTAASKVGCQLREPVSLPKEFRDTKPLLDEVLAANPQGVLLWTEPRIAGRLARDLRQAGFTGSLAGSGSLRSRAFLSSAGAAAEGFVLPALEPATEDAARSQFESEYRVKFSVEPDTVALLAHDAVLLLVQILRESEPDLSYRDFPLRKTYSGASGGLRFDQNGVRIAPLKLLVCANGRFKVLNERGQPGG